jgi:hypothetical protein
MSKNTMSQNIGKIKRHYTHEDFNPFDVMNFVYENCLSGGGGHSVAIVGYSDRFKNSTVSAWWHVMSSRQLLTGTKPPIPLDNHYTTHTGTVIKFISLPDHQDSQSKYQEIVDDNSQVLLCNKYKHPNLKSITRAHANTIDIYDFSGNNVDNSVDNQDNMN